MAANLVNEVPKAKELFDKASSILGYDLLSKCVNGVYPLPFSSF